MSLRPLAVFACFAASAALCAPAAAETVYKYRRPDGRTVYSNRLVPGLELIETFDYKFPEAVQRDKSAARTDAEGEARIRIQLDVLQAAWNEVQDASRALAGAEKRLQAGVEPQPGDREGVASAGSAQPGVGVPAASSPATGGSLSGRRGRASPEYLARVEALESAVLKARARLDTALRKYNELR